MHNKNAPFTYEVVTVHPHTTASPCVFGSGSGREAEGECAVQCLEISVSQLTGFEENVAPRLTGRRAPRTLSPFGPFLLFEHRMLSCCGCDCCCRCTAAVLLLLLLLL